MVTYIFPVTPSLVNRTAFDQAGCMTVIFEEGDPRYVNMTIDYLIKTMTDSFFNLQ
jgi:hypothetical protein